MMEMGRGVTFLHGAGGYTHKQRDVIMAVVNITQVTKIKLIANCIDPGAFMIIIAANEVMGKGFSHPNSDLRNMMQERLRQQASGGSPEKKV